MAAFRNGIKTVIIPADNARDLEEIDQTVRKALQFILVNRADQVLDAALNRPAEAAETTPRRRGKKTEELPAAPPAPAGGAGRWRPGAACAPPGVNPTPRGRNTPGPPLQ